MGANAMAMVSSAARTPRLRQSLPLGKRLPCQRCKAKAVLCCRLTWKRFARARPQAECLVLLTCKRVIQVAQLRTERGALRGELQAAAVASRLAAAGMAEERRRLLHEVNEARGHAEVAARCLNETGGENASVRSAHPCQVFSLHSDCSCLSSRSGFSMRAPSPARHKENYLVSSTTYRATASACWRYMLSKSRAP